MLLQTFLISPAGTFFRRYRQSRRAQRSGSKKFRNFEPRSAQCKAGPRGGSPPRLRGAVSSALAAPSQERVRQAGKIRREPAAEKPPVVSGERHPNQNCSQSQPPCGDSHLPAMDLVGERSLSVAAGKSAEFRRRESTRLQN